MHETWNVFFLPVQRDSSFRWNTHQIYTGFLKKTCSVQKKKGTRSKYLFYLLSFKYIWMWRGMPGFWQCTPAIFITDYSVKKVKWSRYRPGVAQRVDSGIALLFHDRVTRRGWLVSSTLRPHFTPGKDTVPILQEAVGASGPVWTGGKSRPHRDSIPDRPARSQSLHRLSYPAHDYSVTYTIYCYEVKYRHCWNLQM